MLDCPCRLDKNNKYGYALLFHVIDSKNVDITDEDRLAIELCLVKWGARVRASSFDKKGFLCYPLFIAATNTNQRVVSFFLDECGLDVNIKLSFRKETVLHYFITCTIES